MKFIRTEPQSSEYEDFKEEWIKEEVDMTLGKLVIVNSDKDIYRCIGFCSALDDYTSDYYYILYDGINDSFLFYSAVGSVDLLENKYDKKEYINILSKIKKESKDLKIEDDKDRSIFRTNHIKKCVVGHIQFSLYNHKFYWDLN